MKVNSMNPKTVAICLAVLIFASVLAASAILTTGESGTSEVTVFLVPSRANVRVNQTFDVSINVSLVSDLYGWEFKLGYNNSLLEIVNFTEGSFLNSIRDTYFVPKVMSADDYILAGCTSLRNVAGVSGNGTLATVEFRAKKLGSCTLDLYDTKLVNSARQLVEHGMNDGTVTVSGCVVIRVQYIDDYPRSGAGVRKSWPLPYISLGTTNESGMVESCGILSGPQDYQVQAWYSGSQFGPNTGLHVDGNGDGSTIVSANYEITPPVINILSPQNQTYINSTIPLTYTIYDFSSISWIGYSLDNQSSTTITGNTTLTVEDGTHRIVVYANDSFGNMGCSQIVYFTIGEHDIAVANITVSKTIVGQGYSTSIKVIVENQGDRTETFNVTLYANTTAIATQTVTLASGNSTTITFTWNTTSFVKGNYTIWAFAWPVQGETDLADNNCTGITVTVSWLGDLDGDFRVDENDLWHFCGAFIDYYKIHVLDSLCDFNNDGKIDEDDLWTFCGAFIDYWKAH